MTSQYPRPERSAAPDPDRPVEAGRQRPDAADAGLGTSASAEHRPDTDARGPRTAEHPVDQPPPADGDSPRQPDDRETTAVRRRSFLSAGPRRGAGAPREEPGPDAPTTATGRAGDGPDETTTTEDPRAAEEPDTGVLLAGASVEPGPRSRAAAHWWGLVLTLLLAPLAWYLTADGGARLTLPADNPWETGEPNLAALSELAAGLLVLAVVLLAARWSSLGALLTGSLVFLLGLPFLAFPAETRGFLEPAIVQLRAFNDLGANVAHHLVADGASGRFLLYGLTLIFVGVVSHGARRQGRREEQGKAARARNREIADRRMAESRRRSSEHRMSEVQRRSDTPA